MASEIERRSVLVITGAGASIGCHDPSSNVTFPLPPLTRTLVTALTSTAEAQPCRQLLLLTDQVMNSKHLDFESALRHVFESYEHIYAEQFDQLRIALAALMDQPTANARKFGTLYTRLFALLRAVSEKTAVINMNYDRLAELALSPPPSGLGEFIDRSDGIGLYHPHGHCNWTDVPSHAPINTSHDRERLEAYGSDSLRMIVNNRPAQRELRPDHRPALAIPISGDHKSLTAWPTTHFNSLCQYLQSASDVIIIGWRGADRHIIDLIDLHLPPSLNSVTVVGASRDGIAETEENLPTVVSRADHTYRDESGFEGFMAPDGLATSLFPI